MYNLEDFLVQYATFNWQHVFFNESFNANIIIIIIFCIIFVLIFFTKCVCKTKKSTIKYSSNYCQTDEIARKSIESDLSIIESGDILLQSIFNHEYFRNHIFHRWITNFNDFQFSKTISKNCRIIEFNHEYCDRFEICQLRTIDNKELVTFTFLLKCARLSLIVNLIIDEQQNRLAHLTVTDIELSALVLIRITNDGSLFFKMFPDCVCDFHCQLIADGLTDGENKMCLAEFKRDFKLIIMQTLEIDWKTQNNLLRKESQTCQDGKHCEIGDSSCSVLYTPEQLIDNSQSIEEDESEEKLVLNQQTESFSKHENLHVKEQQSHMSLFTTDSYDFYEHGEESPFHDRVSSKLIGRTLVVGLVKVVEAQELKPTPLKSGYCVLELDEPYQRHVSHLISLSDYPIWNQHFVFSLNSNSQRLSIELFHASKKCQNPVSLGVSIIPISLIIIDPSENYFPINNNQIGSRKSWRCDVIPGGVDSKIPAFLIDFQIMRNVHEIMKPTADPPSDISSNNSGISLPSEKVMKLIENIDLDSDNGGHKMQTIPEAQTPDNTLTKNRSNDTDNKVYVREKTNSETERSKSMIRKIRHQFSRFSVPWINEKSKSDDCLDHITDDPVVPISHNPEVPVQPPAELFIANPKPKFFSKISDVDLRNSRSLSISLKKVFNLPAKKIGKIDKYKEKSLEQLFKNMDPKLFDTISNEGFNRIMNNN